MKRLSVVIPTCDRPQELSLCLGGIARQTRKPCEVILVNDGQSELPSAKLKSILGGIPLIILKTKGLIGQARAKNKGINKASGEIVVFTDDDCLACPDWLAGLAQALSLEKVAVAVGRITEKKRKDKKDSFSDLVLNLPFYPLYLIIRKRAGGTIYPNGRVDANLDTRRDGFCHWGGTGNMAVRKKYLESVRGFDQHLISGCSFEEPDLCQRIRSRGGKVFFASSARVYHYSSFQGKGSEEERVFRVRANEIYFGLKDIAFQNPLNFLLFLSYQGWQLLVYALLGLIRKKYWHRIRGKYAGFKNWRLYKYAYRD